MNKFKWLIFPLLVSILMPGPMMARDAYIDCDNFDSSNSAITDIIQKKWRTIFDRVEANGFTAGQLRRSLMAVFKEIQAQGAQKKAQDYLIKWIHEPSMLLSGSNAAATSFRENVRSLLDKTASRAPSEPNGRVFSAAELQDALIIIKERQSQIQALELLLAMKQKRELSLDDNLRRFNNALLLTAFMNDEAKATRRGVLAQLQRALNSNNDIMVAKCKVWQTLK